MSLPDLKKAALEFVARGWPVFPCNPLNKRPLITAGFKAASTDHITVEHWWTQWPNAMIGMPTGARTDAWVLDVDDPEAFAPWAWMIPPTRKVMTGKGFHFYFRHGAGVRNAQRHPKRGWPFPELPGAEVRGEGGYVILPPSRHPSGRLYAWAEDCDPVTAPAELLRIVTRQNKTARELPSQACVTLLAPRCESDTPYGIKALEGEVQAISQAIDGGQEAALNGAALKIGGLVAGGGLSLATAKPALIAAGLAMPSYNPGDPWTPDAIAAKVERGLTAGVRTPRGPEAIDPYLALGRRDGALNGDMGGSPKPPSIVAAPYRWPDPASIPRRQWLFGRWLLRGEVTAIFAPGGVGKSTLSTAIAVSLASGRDLLGQAPLGKIGAWLYNLEDAPDELDRQTAATCLRHGVDREECANRLFVNSGITMPLCTASEVNGDPAINEKAFAELTETIRGQGIGVVIIDPLVSSHRVSEASNEAIDAIAKRWKRLAHETGCAVVLVHHTRKLMGREATAEDGRGAVALRDAARVVLVMNKVTLSEAEALGVGPEVASSLVKVTMGKASRAPDAGTAWFKLEGQSLGNGANHAEPDFVGVATAFDKPDVFAGITNYHLYFVQRRIDERDWRDNVQAKDWIGHLVAGVAGLDAAADKGKIKAILKEWKRSGALVIDNRIDRKGDIRPCIAIGKQVDPIEISNPHLEIAGAESAEGAGV